MSVCCFCGNELKPGTGTLYIKKDGKPSYFCSSKCQKNARLGREGRRVKWTKNAREFKA